MEHKNKNNDSVNRARFTMHRKHQNVVHVSVEFEFPNVVCGTCRFYSCSCTVIYSSCTMKFDDGKCRVLYTNGDSFLNKIN